MLGEKLALGVEAGERASSLDSQPLLRGQVDSSSDRRIGLAWWMFKAPAIENYGSASCYGREE